MDKRTRNVILIAMLVAGVSAIAYIWVHFGSKPKQEDVPAVSKMQDGNILLDGRVVAERVADLGFVPSAKIVSITKKAGDTVKAGDVLAMIDSTDTEAQAAAARAEAEAAQATRNQFEDVLKKEKLALKDLHGNSKKIQKAQIASAEDSVQAQENIVVAEQDNVRNAQAQLAKTVLRAPFDGLITRQDAEVGEVAGVAVAPFMTLESAGSTQKIEAFASDLDIDRIRVGDTAQIGSDALKNGKTLSAHVSAVGPDTTLHDGKAAYKITLLLDAPEPSLRSGMYASVSFTK